VESPWPWKLTTEKRFGNRMAYLEGDGPPPGEIVLRFRVERRPFRGIPAGDAARDGFLDPDRYLKSDRLIPLEGKIRELAEQEGKGHSSPSGKVRAFYDYVVRTMTYRKDGTGWGRGDAVWACTSRYGNCTDFHSLFIGMVRSARIPARFVIGFPIPAGRPEGEVAGYHCWAEFFDPAKGWRGVDASEAWKTRRADDYFGTLPNDRIEFTIGRDLILEPPQRSEALNYFIYPYVEVDGKPHEGVTRLFHFRRLDAPTG
jgi:transglutaminase-like putative cysteine protease